MIFVALIACGLSAIGSIGATALIIAVAVAPAMVRLQRVPSLLARGRRIDRQFHRPEDRASRGRNLLSDARGIYREVIRRMSQHRWRFVLAIAGVALGAAMEVLKPWPLKILIDNVLSGKPLAIRMAIASYSRMNLLSPRASPGSLIYLLTGILTVANNYISISIGQRMVNDLRGQLFDHLQRLSLGFHRRREIGDLMVRIVYDTFAIQTITMNGIFQILASSILLVGMFIVMIKIDVTMTLIALGVIPMLVILIASVSGTIDRLATEARIKESALYTVAHRALASIHVVQAFTREAESYREFVRSSSESLGENLRVYTFQSIYAGGVSVVIAIGTALVMYFGALHVHARGNSPSAA